MNVKEIEIEIGELETRLDRLRALYEQYFIGLERLEPQIPRKDVERRMWMLRKEQIHNTGLRFKLNMLVQRYNTFQQHWGRITREIENGTYKRDVIRAANRIGAREALTLVGKKRAKSFALLAKHQDEKDKAASEADAAAAAKAPEAPPAVEPSPKAAEAKAPAAQDESKRRVAALAEQLKLQRQKAPIQSRENRGSGPLDLDLDLDAPASKRGPRSTRPPPRKTNRPVSRRPSPRSVRPADLGHAPSSRNPVVPPPARLPTQPTAARPPAQSPPLATPRQATPPPAPSRPLPPGQAPPPAPGRPLPPGQAAAPPVPSRPGLPRQATPPPVPSRPGPPAPAPEGGLPDTRMREIYSKYVETKRSVHESTAGLTYDKLAKSLRDQAEKLQSAHGKNKSVDYEVVVKNGKTLIRPIMR